jgi:IclR family KDG regulon transcriptional repressor
MEPGVPASGANLERYVAILDVFAGLRSGVSSGNSIHANKEFGVTDISAALRLSRGTVSRYLRRLEAAGVLIRLPDRRYALSPRVYHWGQAAKPGNDVQGEARPVMEELAERFGEPVSLFVLASDVAVCIDQVDGIHPVRLNAAVGRQLPLHTGASPRLLLAYAPAEFQEQILAREPFPQVTPATITSASDLRRALLSAREDGYVVSVGESNEGVVGIAAVVRDASGNAVAALSIAGLETRLAGSRRSDCLASVLDAAERISQALGYFPLVANDKVGRGL